MNPEIIIHLLKDKSLPNDLFSEFNSVFFQRNILVLPTVIEDDFKKHELDSKLIVGLLNNNKSEAAKEDVLEQRNLVKEGLKVLATAMREIEIKIPEHFKAKPDNKFSKAFSMQLLINSKKYVRLLFEKNAPLKDWDMCVETAVDFIIEGCEKKDSELNRIFELYQQEPEFPFFLVFNNSKKKWEPLIHL